MLKKGYVFCCLQNVNKYLINYLSIKNKILKKEGNKVYKPKKVESKLLIYQKYTDVIDYGYNLLVKYPKIEKYALSTSIRNSMFETLRLILYANKIADKYTRIKILNKIDAEIAMQGFYVRFSYKQKYISSKNYIEWSRRLEEIGKILGGWIKACLKE